MLFSETPRGCTVCTNHSLISAGSLCGEGETVMSEQDKKQKRGSCWFTGAVWGGKYWEELTTYSRVFTSIIVYWRTTINCIKEERLHVETWCRKWQNVWMNYIATELKLIIQAGFQSCLLTGDLRDEWPHIHWFTSTHWRHHLSPRSGSFWQTHVLQVSPSSLRKRP